MDEIVVFNCNFFLNVPIVGSPASLESFVVMKRPVAPMSKMPMATRVWSLKPMMCGLSCVLKVCVLEMMSLKCMSCPLLWWLVGGVICTGAVVSRMRWLAWIDVAILGVLASYETGSSPRHLLFLRAVSFE